MSRCSTRRGGLKRWDHYPAFDFQGLNLSHMGEEGPWPNLSIVQVLDIAASGAVRPAWQMLFDNSRTMTRQVYTGEVRARETRADQSKSSLGVPFTHYLPFLAWPSLYHEIQSRSSAHAKMKVLELPADPNQPRLTGLRLTRFAETQDYWFDPERDHVLMERIRIQPCVRTLREFVKELGQTWAGSWYPGVIWVESTNLGPDGVPDKASRWEKRVLFDCHSPVDNTIFDPATSVH